MQKLPLQIPLLVAIFTSAAPSWASDVKVGEAQPAKPAVPASTVTPEMDAARVLLLEGYRLARAGRCLEATAALRTSVATAPTTKALLNLARCEEALGRFRAARARWVESLARATEEGMADAAVEARARLAALDARVPRVTFTITDASASDIAIEVDGEDVGAPGASVPLDPGDHVVRILARDRVPARHELAVGPGDALVVPIAPGPPVAADLEDARDAATSPDLKAADNAAPRIPAAPVPTVPTSSALNVGAKISLGVGLTAIAVGAGAGLVVLAKQDAAKGYCTLNVCDSEGIRLRDDALGWARVSTVAFIGGAGLALGGVGLWLATRSTPGLRGVRVGPGASGAAVGVTIQGAL